MNPYETDWIKQAYQEAENKDALACVREVGRLEKCGCQNCQKEIRRIYESWAGWNDHEAHKNKIVFFQ